MCAHENMNMIAVGFQNGTVIVIRGNITRDRTSRVRIVHEEKGDRVYVTGNIHESSEGSSSTANPKSGRNHPLVLRARHLSGFAFCTSIKCV